MVRKVHHSKECEDDNCLGCRFTPDSRLDDIEEFHIIEQRRK